MSMNLEKIRATREYTFCQICGLDIIVSNHNIHISDSYTITQDVTKEFILSTLVENFPEILNYRSIKSMLCEWKAHNILHQHQIEEERTEDVDLELHQKWYRKVGYWLIAHLLKEKEM